MSGLGAHVMLWIGDGVALGYQVISIVIATWYWCGLRSRGARPWVLWSSTVGGYFFLNLGSSMIVAAHHFVAGTICFALCVLGVLGSIVTSGLPIPGRVPAATLARVPRSRWERRVQRNRVANQG